MSDLQGIALDILKDILGLVMSAGVGLIVALVLLFASIPLFYFFLPRKNRKR